MRVLIVDDIREIGATVKGTLARMRSPTDLIVETDPDRARRLVQENDFDLVISDYRMPGITGLQVLSAARERNPKGLRILMTGYHEIPATAGELERAGVDAYLSKPVQARDLLALVGAMLAGDERIVEQQRRFARDIERQPYHSV